MYLVHIHSSLKGADLPPVGIQKAESNCRFLCCELLLEDHLPAVAEHFLTRARALRPGRPFASAHIIFKLQQFIFDEISLSIKPKFEEVHSRWEHSRFLASSSRTRVGTNWLWRRALSSHSGCTINKARTPQANLSEPTMWGQ